MKDQILDIVSSVPIGKNSVIPIKVDISKLFGTNQIQFQLSIKDEKLMLIGPKVSSQDPITKSTTSKEEISNFGQVS